MNNQFVYLENVNMINFIKDNIIWTKYKEQKIFESINSYYLNNRNRISLKQKMVLEKIYNRLIERKNKDFEFKSYKNSFYRKTKF